MHDDTYDMNNDMITKKEDGVKRQIETEWLSQCQTRVNKVATRHCSRSLQDSQAQRNIMTDNRKQEKDFTKEVDELLPLADATAKVIQSINNLPSSLY